MTTKTLTKRINRVLALVLTIAALMVGQSVWATTKTVTYRITDFSLDSGGSGYNFVFTRQGDTPFETSAPTTYTGYVNRNSIGQNPGNGGHISLQLADGFELSLSWGEGSDIRLMDNCIYPYASNKYITYGVSCSNDNYYVTHVMMTGTNSGYKNGLLQPYPHYNEPIDYDYSSEWHFHNSYLSAYAFGQITITYTDVPLLSIFESDGENAYKIKDKYDLRHLAAYVNNGGNNCSGLTFRQTQDIACDATYVPIGYRFSNSNKSYFKGTYDGQGHTVSGITVSRTGGSDADGCIGLFGYVEYGGTVQNVVLASSTFTGNDKIGGIVGLNWGGTVKNCRVESSVTIKAGCNNAWNHGGIVGYNDSGTIEGCVSAASILNNGKSTHQFCGGITGRTSSTIRDCLYTGTTIEAADYKGAICGYSDGGATYANNYYTAIALGGVGAEGGSSDQDGTRRARTVTLGANVALVGNETTYEIRNHSSLTTIGSTALSYNDGNATTIYSGATQTLTLSYTGIVPEGYAAVYSVNGTQIDGNTFTMPAEDVSATWIPAFTGMTLESINNKLTATFDGSSLTTVNIPIDITVESVVLTREFTVDKPATIMLPFAIDVANTSGAAFYTYTGVSYDTNTNKWVATMTQVTSGTIAANTPYLVVPSATSITFSGGATLNTTTNSQQTTIGDWAFKGTYAQKTWAAADCGRDYGFAATSGKATDGVTDVQAGDFVKLDEGAFIRPLRAYLTYTGTGNPWAAPKHRAGTELPSSISVVLVNSDGTTSVIENGELRIENCDVWYTLDGSKLDKQPTKKGLYIHNGKKEVVK